MYIKIMRKVEGLDVELKFFDGRLSLKSKV